MYFYVDILIIIFEHCEFKEKLKLKSTSRTLYKLLQIKTIPFRYWRLIDNEILKNMKLHTLYINYNNKITDEGIKNMKLHTLYAHSNSKISYKKLKPDLLNYKIHSYE